MKVLWLVSITIPAAADACGLQAKEIGGGWLSGALGGMTAAPDAPAITVASVDARAETLTVCSKNGVSFALVPTGSVENFSALLKKIAPDLVHIWGTEYAAARTIQQAAQAAGIPVLVGIQGVMVDCALHLNDGVPARLLHSCAAQHLIDRHVPGGLLDVNQARFDTLAQSEAAVLANARHVTGRTNFDRSAVQSWPRRPVITPATKRCARSFTPHRCGTPAPLAKRRCCCSARATTRSKPAYRAQSAARRAGAVPRRGAAGGGLAPAGQRAAAAPGD